MPRSRPFTWRGLLRYGAVLAALALVAGTLFVASGVYNVAASRDHWPIVTWLIERVRTRSVDTWSGFVETPASLDDPAMVRLGAAHFEGGCTPCHSRPGDPANAIVAAMLPPPPPLGLVVKELEAKELFWIVKHGLKFTAMPAWPTQQRDDEVWVVTAFLARLPGMSPQEYRELSGAVRAGDEGKSAAELAASTEAVALTECVRCHGDASLPPLSALVPRLNGQSRAYLERALAEYAEEMRASGVMQPVATLLTPDERRRLAAWYAGLEPLPGSRVTGPGDSVRGRRLAEDGDPEQGIPPCLACHARERAESFPALAGQNAAYLAAQLAVFRSGARDRSVHGQIMTVIAKRLGRQQAEDAAAWFASLPPGGAPSVAEHPR